MQGQDFKPGLSNQKAHIPFTVFFFLEREAPFPESLRAYGIHLISVIGWIVESKGQRGFKEAIQASGQNAG